MLPVLHNLQKYVVRTRDPAGSLPPSPSAVYAAGAGVSSGEWKVYLRHQDVNLVQEKNIYVYFSNLIFIL